MVDLRGGGGPAVARVAADADADDRRDRPRAVDQADAVVVAVGDEQVAVRVLDRVDRRHARVERRAAVAAERGVAVAGDRLDPAGARVDPPYAGVAVVRDDEAVGVVAADVRRLAELRVDGGAARRRWSIRPPMVTGPARSWPAAMQSLAPPRTDARRALGRPKQRPNSGLVAAGACFSPG